MCARFCAPRFSHNGERLGTYVGHNGTIWSVSVDCTSSHLRAFRVLLWQGGPRADLVCFCVRSTLAAKSEFLLSGSADNTMKLWSVQTGKCLYTWEFPTAVKRVAWKYVLYLSTLTGRRSFNLPRLGADLGALSSATCSEDDSVFLSITEQRSGFQGAVRVHRLNREEPTKRATSLFPRSALASQGRGVLTALPPRVCARAESEAPETEFNPIGSKAMVAVFAPLSALIITGHESGKVALFDSKTGDEIQSNEKAHNGQVTDLQLSADGTYFVTSSKDKSARLHRTEDLVVLKTFTTNTPLNSASITPLRPYVRRRA